jgi:hypothetical protein
LGTRGSQPSHPDCSVSAGHKTVIVDPAGSWAQERQIVIWSQKTDRPQHLRAMIAAEPKALTVEAVVRAVRTFEGRLACLTTTGVVSRPRTVEFFAPVSGYITAEEIQEPYVDDACVIARISASLVPDAVPTRHRVAARWSTALQMAREYDVLIVPSWPDNLFDLLLVSAFAARARMLTAGTILSPANRL